MTSVAARQHGKCGTNHEIHWL